MTKRIASLSNVSRPSAIGEGDIAMQPVIDSSEISKSGIQGKRWKC